MTAGKPHSYRRRRTERTASTVVLRGCTCPMTVTTVILRALGGTQTSNMMKKKTKYPYNRSRTEPVFKNERSVYQS